MPLTGADPRRRAELSHHVLTPPDDVASVRHAGRHRVGSRTPNPGAVQSDAQLIAAVRAGNRTAFGELYHRHRASASNLAKMLSRDAASAEDLVAESFARILDGLLDGRGPGESFRAYLITTVRHTAYDRTRKDKRLQFTDDESVMDSPVVLPDPVMEGAERSIVCAAFSSLPNRWQAVLWHVIVEGQSAAEAGTILGISASNVRTLTQRAKEKLRQEYLQAHLRRDCAPGCKDTMTRLGAWSRGGLSHRDTAAVAAHLAECTSCTIMAGELTMMNTGLKVLLAPVLLGAAATGYLASQGAQHAVAATTAAATHGSTGLIHGVFRSGKTLIGTSAAGATTAATLIAAVVTTAITVGVLIAPGTAPAGAAAQPTLTTKTIGPVSAAAFQHAKATPTRHPVIRPAPICSNTTGIAVYRKTHPANGSSAATATTTAPATPTQASGPPALGPATPMAPTTASTPLPAPTVPDPSLRVPTTTTTRSATIAPLPSPTTPVDPSTEPSATTTAAASDTTPATPTSVDATTVDPTSPAPSTADSTTVTTADSSTAETSTAETSTAETSTVEATVAADSPTVADTATDPSTVDTAPADQTGAAATTSADSSATDVGAASTPATDVTDTMSETAGTDSSVAGPGTDPVTSDQATTDPATDPAITDPTTADSMTSSEIPTSAGTSAELTSTTEPTTSESATTADPTTQDVTTPSPTTAPTTAASIEPTTSEPAASDRSSAATTTSPMGFGLLDGSTLGGTGQSMSLIANSIDLAFEFIDLAAGGSSGNSYPGSGWNNAGMGEGISRSIPMVTTAAQASVPAGTTTTFTVSLANPGISDSSPATLYLSLPAGVTVGGFGGQPDCGATPAGTVTLGLPVLQPNETISYTLRLTAPAGTKGGFARVFVSD